MGVGISLIQKSKINALNEENLLLFCFCKTAVGTYNSWHSSTKIGQQQKHSGIEQCSKYANRYVEYCARSKHGTVFCDN